MVNSEKDDSAAIPCPIQHHNRLFGTDNSRPKINRRVSGASLYKRQPPSASLSLSPQPSPSSLGPYYLRLPVSPTVAPRAPFYGLYRRARALPLHQLLAGHLFKLFLRVSRPPARETRGQCLRRRNTNPSRRRSRASAHFLSWALRYVLSPV